MFGLSHLFYPWGLLVQVAALIHFFRRRPEGYWFFIIIFGSALGAAVYLLVEAVPDLGLAARHLSRLRPPLAGIINALEIQILDNPSPGNYEELGELLLEQKQYAKGREAFNPRHLCAQRFAPRFFITVRNAPWVLAISPRPSRTSNT